MRCKKVNIDDVFPVEDEYGNQFLSRDYSLKVNQEYVRELAESFGPNGEPDEPPVLVQDGGIYRIKAGNSRVLAMRSRGTKRFTAIIDDNDTAQALVEAAIRTNRKKKYEPIEESRFLQQLTMFADDEYVAETAGIEVERVKRIRRGKQAVDDAAEDMTLLRLAAIGEFADDPEAVAELANCSERDYESIADRYRRKAERDRAVAEFEAVCADAGIKIAEKEPEGWVTVLGCSIDTASPDDLRKKVEGIECEIPVAYWNYGGWLYICREASDISETERRAQSERVSFVSEFDAAKSKRYEWIADRIASLDQMESTALACTDYAASRISSRMDDFVRKTGKEVVMEPTAYLVACGYSLLDTIEAATAYSITHGSGIGYSSEFERAHVELFDAMELDGFEHCGAEKALRDAFEGRIK